MRGNIYIRYWERYGTCYSNSDLNLGTPTTLDADSLEAMISEARASVEDERDRTRVGFSNCADPADTSMQSWGRGLERLKQQFPFLAEYSDEFIKDTGVDVLIKAETAARKLQKWDKDKKAEDKLYSNRETLPFFKIQEGKDNRFDTLHMARILPGATCTAAKLWLHAREVMGNEGHPPLSTYDMAAIGLGGSVSPRGWVEIHRPSSPNLSIKMFSISSCMGRARGNADEDFPELEDITELKSSLRVLRGAMQYVHPWNRSIDALENFFNQNNFCSKDLVGYDKHVVVLSQFTDYVLGENACRWRGKEEFLDTRALRNTWADFFSQKASAFKQKGHQSSQKFKGVSSMDSTPREHEQRVPPSRKYNVPGYLFKDDICVLWNLGLCLKPAGQCMTKFNKPLRHVCNWRNDLSKLHIPCEKNHVATLFHR